MTETNMTEEVLRVAATASQHSDRVLFLAALMVLLAFGGVGFKFLLKQIDKLNTDAKESRNEYHATLKTIIADQRKDQLDLRVSLDRNTDALRINNALLEKQNRKELHS